MMASTVRPRRLMIPVRTDADETRRRRPNPAAIIATLMLAPLLAGCMAPGDAPPGNEGGNGTEDEATAALIQAAGKYQTWTLSDHWRWDMEIRGFDRFSDVTLVYFEKAGPEFVIGTPNRDEALYHAVFSVNPILGRVHEGHLSPHERGVHATMFPFESADDHLDDGETWTTRFYDRFLRLEATFSTEVPTPDGPKPGFLIVGNAPETTFTVRYNYVAEYKWFTQLEVVDRDGQLFMLTLKDHGTGYSGPGHFFRAKDFLHETFSGKEGVLTERKTFVVEPSHVEDDRVEGFAVSTDIQSTDAVAAEIRILGPNGDELYRRSFDDEVSGEFNIDEIYPQGEPSAAALGERPNWPAGTYTVEFTFAGDATAEIHIVGLQDNSGRI